VVPVAWKELRSAYELRLRQQIAPGKMTESTRKRYEHTVKSFEEFLKEREVFEVLKMDRAFVEAYKVWRRAKIMEKKFSRNGRGLSLDVAILHGVFAVAVENEMVQKNPVRMEGRPGDNPEAGAQPFDGEALQKLRKGRTGPLGISSSEVDGIARFRCCETYVVRSFLGAERD
jgi:integrase-like protein